jgi:hypothetical protein
MHVVTSYWAGTSHKPNPVQAVLPPECTRSTGAFASVAVLSAARAASINQSNGAACGHARGVQLLHGVLYAIGFNMRNICSLRPCYFCGLDSDS